MEELKNILEWIALIVAIEIGIMLLISQIKLLGQTIRYIHMKIEIMKRKKKIEKEWNKHDDIEA